MNCIYSILFLLAFPAEFMGNSLQSNSVVASDESEKAKHLLVDAEEMGNETKNDTKKIETVHQNVQNWNKLGHHEQILLVIVVVLANVLFISFLFLCYFLYRRRHRRQQQNRGAQILLGNGNNNDNEAYGIFIRMKTLESRVKKNQEQQQEEKKLEQQQNDEMEMENA